MRDDYGPKISTPDSWRFTARTAKDRIPQAKKGCNYLRFRDVVGFCTLRKPEDSLISRRGRGYLKYNKEEYDKVGKNQRG